MQGIFVAGTGTGVGKTLFSAGLAWLLKRKGIDVGVMKPFATADSLYSKTYRSADVAILAEAAEAEEKDPDLNPSFYKAAAAPLMAAKLTGRPLPRIDRVLESLKRLGDRHEFLIVEGIGGVCVPIDRRHYVVDFAKAAGLPVVIVSIPYLGTLNHTLLTVDACRARDLTMAGIVVNMMPRKPTLVERMAPRYLASLSRIPVIGTLPRLSRPDYASAGRAIDKAINIEKLLSLH